MINILFMINMYYKCAFILLILSIVTLLTCIAHAAFYINTHPEDDIYLKYAAISGSIGFVTSSICCCFAPFRIQHPQPVTPSPRITSRSIPEAMEGVLNEERCKYKKEKIMSSDLLVYNTYSH